MRKRRALLLKDDDAENFWPAFADLTSTIALILFVLVLLAYIQNLISGKNLQYLKAQLDNTLMRLDVSRKQISRSEKQLRLLEDEVTKTMAEVEAGQTQLKLSEEKVTEQQQIIAESNRELGNLRSKLQGIAILRVDVVNKVKASIEAELSAKKSSSGEPLVLVADNGNIIINENLVFEYNSYKIKQEGKPLLKTLSKAFASLLAEAELRENIDVILIQGHTDERGSASYNRGLSAKRANAVLDYMFDNNATLERLYGRFFAASAYSEFRPINKAKNEAAYEQNRRIEVSVVLKDTNVKKVIDEYMQNINPIFQEAATEDDSNL
jgi:chemotaxis protein MotB